jgi:hypothetical protein
VRGAFSNESSPPSERPPAGSEGSPGGELARVPNLGKGRFHRGPTRRFRARFVGLVTLVAVAGSVALVQLGSGRSSTTETFVGDFEVGSPGWQQFDGLQYQETRPLAESFALVSGPVRQGRSSVRMTARHGYSRFGHNEATLLSWRGREQPGDEYWYAWSTLFPREWVSPFKWGIFTQWHAELPTSPIFGFSAAGDRANFTLLSGLTDERANRAAVNRSVPLLATLAKGRWNDFVMRVRWSLGSDGLVEVYHRVEGERSLRKLVSFRDVPTFQVTKAGTGVGAYLLLGIYRASFCAQPTRLGCTSSLGTQTPSTLYHDGFVRERSFKAAAGRAFPGSIPQLPTSDSRAVQQEGAQLTPLTLRVAPRPTSVQADRGCPLCRASASAGRARASIAGPADDRDSAVLEYRIRQRATTAVRYRLSVGANRLTGPLVVTQLRDKEGRVLTELYVGPKGTLRLSSPAGALRPRRLDVDTAVAVGPGAEPRDLELRLSRTELHLGISGRLIVRFANVAGPKRSARVDVRVGIDRYDGARPGGGTVRVVYDELIVGSS